MGKLTKTTSQIQSLDENESKFKVFKLPPIHFSICSQRSLSVIRTQSSDNSHVYAMFTLSDDGVEGKDV